MEYVGIALVVVSIAIFCIYKVANNLLDLNLRLKPLVLCGICAVFISIILPRIVVSLTGFIGTISVLALFAIVFAYFVAYYDERHESTEHIGVIEVASPKTEILFDKGEHIEQTIKEFLPAIISNNQDDMVAASVLKTKIQGDSVDMDKNVEVIENEAQLKPDSDSLDDLLNFAFSQKEQSNYNISLDAFMRAYKRYHDNEVAPFLVVEIGNIFKNKGSYDEAINIFMEGRNLPILQNQQAFVQEFITNIAYLRIVKNILLQYHLSFIPFNEIPTQIAEEIDKEFQDWRDLA